MPKFLLYIIILFILNNIKNYKINYKKMNS
jgi:hypothetical protein